jgi:hypothetical protein
MKQAIWALGVHVSKIALIIMRIVPIPMAVFRPRKSATGAAMNQPLTMAQTEYAVLIPPIRLGPGLPIHSSQAWDPWTALKTDASKP